MKGLSRAAFDWAPTRCQTLCYPSFTGALTLRALQGKPGRHKCAAQWPAEATGPGSNAGLHGGTAHGLPEQCPPIRPPTRSLTHPGCMSTRVRGCGRRHDAIPVGSGLVKDASPQAPKTTVICYVTEKCPRMYEDTGEKRTVCVWGRAV